MFKLQRLEIINFKSFADRTELLFNDGITAVVGPNGCGKSNVAESIAWVLGEQRAKSLRGAEMKDVIFQGTRTRGAANMVEVVLHLQRTTDDEDIEGIGEIDATLEELDEEAHEDNFDIEAIQLRVASGKSNALLDAGNGDVDARSINVDADANALLTDDASSVGSVMSQAGEVDAHAEIALDDESGEEEVVGKQNKKRGARTWRRAKTSINFAPGESVSVTRRLYRSGESEYLLNGRACRLRDIQDLFSGTGLAGAHYAIIEQGRIGQILSAKPMDRRALIEEAAGITKFRVRQRAAEARLEGARGNLARVDDIVSEIERQANSLRRQAAKARRYAALRDELKIILRRVYQSDYLTLTRTLAGLREDLSRANTEEQSLISERARSEQAAREATTRAREAEEYLARERERAAEAALHRDRQEREYSYKEQQIAALEERLATIKIESESLRERLERARTEAETLRASETDLRAVNDEAAQKLNRAEDVYKESLAEVAAVENEIETLRHELLTHTAVAERLSEIGRQLESTLERLRHQADAYEREGERAQTAHAEVEIEVEKLAATIKEARGRLSEITFEREAAGATLNRMRETHNQAATVQRETQDEHTQTRHRLDALAELDARRALYSETIQKLFNASEHEKDFAHRGTLADELRVEPKHEQAIEAVIGFYLQAVIVPTPDDAVRGAAWLEAGNFGRASFLVAGLHGATNAFADAVESEVEEAKIVAPNGEKSNGKAATKAQAKNNLRHGASESLSAMRVVDLLNASAPLAQALERALPREMNARLVASLDEAISDSMATGEICVTLDGAVAAGGSLVTCGTPQTENQEAGLLAFKREMRELELSVKELNAKHEQAQARVRETQAQVGAAEDALLILNEAVARIERETVQLNMTHTQLTSDLERAARHVRVVTEDAARLQAEIKELEERKTKAAMEAQTAEAARQKITVQLADARNILHARRRTAEDESKHLSEQRATAATAAERRRAATADLRRTEHEIQDLEARLARFSAESENNQTRIANLQIELDALSRGADDYEIEQQTQQQTLELRTGELLEARHAADTLADTLNRLNAQFAEAREIRAALEIAQAESNARLNYLHEACLSELAQPIEQLVAECEAQGETVNRDFYNEDFDDGEAPDIDDKSESSIKSKSKTVSGKSALLANGEFDVAAGRARVEELRVRIENLGAVNMMALEELAEAEGRFEFLTTQRKDIVDGILSTEEALREIKRRSRERFREAFEIINRNFGELFGELFGGGRGEMMLIDNEDVLESGIDLIAQPPGKRLQNVLLLSGGEKAMAALALTLAVFRYRPSPFCLLDEVDAPLDEANIGRFTAKIKEMAERTQFIVITHNKRTMEIAESLYGVTMQEAGVSKLVSAKFE